MHMQIRMHVCALHTWMCAPPYIVYICMFKILCIHRYTSNSCSNKMLRKPTSSKGCISANGSQRATSMSTFSSGALCMYVCMHV